MKPTKAGQLHHRITIQQPNRGQDTFGEETLLPWTTFLTVWASVEPRVGREITQAGKVEADYTHRVTIRFREGITSDMRIQHKGRTLNIVSIGDAEERERRIEIMCKEET